ncbi:MAG: hypothetical protein AAF223_13370, partial [Bacteroidota bacterium]
ARPIDPASPTNRAIIIIVGTVFLGLTIYSLSTGKGLIDSLLVGGHLAVTVFLTWALARELDPDYLLSAFIGLPLTAILFFYETPLLIPTVALLQMLRLVNRVTGQTARWGDTLLLLGLAIYLAWNRHYVLSFGISISFTLDGWLNLPLKRHRYLAVICLLSIVMIAWFRGVWFGMVSIPLLYIIPSISTAFILVTIVDYRDPKSQYDNGTGKLYSSRVQAVQLLALAVLLLSAFLEHSDSTFIHAPFWAAVFGINLHFLYRLLRRLL